MGAKIWLQKFFAKHGLIFSAIYVVTFLLLVTFQPKLKFDAFPGDLFFEIDLFGGLTFYMPFVSSLASAVFFTIIFEVYRFLKNP